MLLHEDKTLHAALHDARRHLTLRVRHNERVLARQRASIARTTAAAMAAPAAPASVASAPQPAPVAHRRRRQPHRSRRRRLPTTAPQVQVVAVPATAETTVVTMTDRQRRKASAGKVAATVIGVTAAVATGSIAWATVTTPAQQSAVTTPAASAAALQNQSRAVERTVQFAHRRLVRVHDDVYQLVRRSDDLPHAAKLTLPVTPGSVPLPASVGGSAAAPAARPFPWRRLRRRQRLRRRRRPTRQQERAVVSSPVDVRAPVRPASVTVSTRAMASTFTIHAVPGTGAVEAVQAALSQAVADINAIDEHCTRFEADSDLMAANRAGEQWCNVHPVCFSALFEAGGAYRDTGSRFDPRVLEDLVRLGYDHSRRFGPMSERTESALVPRSPLPSWRPEFRPVSNEVRIGPHAVDLGGIGKGLAVRAAARRLASATSGFLIEAGGDCWCAGEAPEGGPWRLAVEDPSGGELPLAVLAVSDMGVATSSVRICSWSVAGSPVHHLLDPRTGLPGGAGLSAVTVVADDTAIAEVWSKTLFLEGDDHIASAAAGNDIAALWVRTDGTLGCTGGIEPFVIWRAR